MISTFWAFVFVFMCTTHTNSRRITLAVILQECVSLIVTVQQTYSVLHMSAAQIHYRNKGSIFFSEKK